VKAELGGEVSPSEGVREVRRVAFWQVDVGVLYDIFVNVPGAWR